MNPNDICIAIPSHHREDRLLKRTLPLLESWELADRAIVFVAPEEVDSYRRAVGGRIAVQVGALGVRQNRDAIFAYGPPGRPTIQMDDDVHGLYRVAEGMERQYLEPLTRAEFLAVADTGFQACADSGARLWGVYPVANEYFMKDRVRVGLSYIIGSCFGYLGDTDPESPLRTLRPDGEKEDYERSLQCYVEDGAVVRIENACVKHDFYTGSGGLHGTRTPERVHEAAVALTERFPGLAHLNTSKKSGWTEVRLRDVTRKREVYR
jgi:hypothetical protein